MPKKNHLQYLETYSSISTKEVARWAIKLYLRTFYDKGELEELVEKYMEKERDVRADIQTFFVEIKQRPPTSIRAIISNVKTFLIENDIELPTKFWKHLSRRIKGNAQTDDRIPTTDEFKQILIQMPQHAQAYYLTLCSSGMRGGELLQIKMSEIDLDTDPVLIRIRGEYTKNKIL